MSGSHGNATDPHVRLSLALVYSSPLLATSFIHSLSNTYYMKYAADVLLVTPAAIGMIWGGAKLWEALCDPVAGYLSDRTSHRLGRRRSWILLALLPVGLFPLFMWRPPEGLEGTALLAWLALASFGFLTAFSSLQVPHSALGAEISSRPTDRTRLFASNGVANMLGSGLALLWGLRVIRTADEPRTAVLWLFGGLLVMVGALGVSMVVRTREPAHHQGRGGGSAFEAYRDVLRNPHARILILVALFVHSTYAAIGSVALFMLDDVLDMPNAIELFMAAYFLPTLLSVPVWVRLANRFEKRNLWMVCILCTAAAYGIMSLASPGVSLWLFLPFAVLAGFAGGGMFVYEPSIRAEVIDYDEYRTGERKEGVYSAASQLAGKIGGAAMTVLVGVGLSAAGYVVDGEQTEATKIVIRLLFGGVPVVCFLAALLLLLRFGLTEKLHGAIREELDHRESGVEQ